MNLLFLYAIVISWLLIYLFLYRKNNRELTDWIKKQDAYIKEQEEYINQQHEVINEWVEAYDFILNENEEYADMFLED